MRFTLKAAAVIAVVWITGCADQQPTRFISQPFAPEIADIAAAATQGALLAEIRAATARYHRVEIALAAGYMPATACLPNEGIRYVKPSLVDAVVDPSQPELLLYEALPNGKVHLAGVQFLVPAAAWDALHTSPPTLGEETFLDRRLPPFGALFPNYSLVAWIWLPNPDGTYELFNSSVRC
jgi:hypothetical protein